MHADAVAWRLRTRTLSNADHTLLMGILNVTPDSFSDGGRFMDGNDPAAAARDSVAAGVEMRANGADIIDVGGESTRPGSHQVPLDTEMARVVPVVAGLADAGVVVSVDTSKPEVATAAIEAGAEIVNDVTGLRSIGMVEVCADTGVGVVVMHMQGVPATMQDAPVYDDVVGDVTGYLLGRALVAQDMGVAADRLCLDPGIGFGKTQEHNLALLRDLDRLVATGYPVLVGASRKGFLGGILEAAGQPRPAIERDAATAATTAIAVVAGAVAVRVHDVEAGLQAARTADAIVRRQIQPTQIQPTEKAE